IISFTNPLCCPYISLWITENHPYRFSRCQPALLGFGAEPDLGFIVRFALLCLAHLYAGSRHIGGSWAKARSSCGRTLVVSHYPASSFLPFLRGYSESWNNSQRVNP